MFMGKISDIITHGIPPIPSEKDPLKIRMPAKDNTMFRSVSQCCSLDKNERPTSRQPKHVPAAETIKSGLLPALSIRSTPNPVIGTWTATIVSIPVFPDEKPAETNISLA
uniref:Uncharacterized protein n=1 Tax=Arundo donax TaxID=35708 RepID=A0A0A9D445_ARUDO